MSCTLHLMFQPAIPQAGGLPLIGALPRFLRDPLTMLDEIRHQGNVCRLELGFLDAVTLHHPDHVDHVLRSHHRDYTKGGAFWSMIRELLGNGLPVSEGDEWRRHRRMMQPQFHRQRLLGLATLIIDALDECLEWSDLDSSWQTLDVGARMPHLTMSVASAALLGMNTSRDRSKLIARELDSMQDSLFSAMVAHRLPAWLPLPGRRRFAQSIAIVRHEVQNVIEERRQRVESGDDLLGLLIDSSDEEDGRTLSNEQLLDETISLYLAGYETTATSLQWALALMGEHIEIWERLREECDMVLRGRNPRPSDVRRLPYARWVIQESMRLYPPSWWLPRVAQCDDEIGGYPIPKDTVVAPVMYTVHRHPDFWENPTQFDPERFSPSRSVGRHPLAWCPFGAGPRKCIGQELSLMESTLALAMMTQRFDLAASGQCPRVEMKTTLRPAEPVFLRMRRRRPAHRTITLSGISSSDSSSTMSL